MESFQATLLEQAKRDEPNFEETTRHDPVFRVQQEP